MASEAKITDDPGVEGLEREKRLASYLSDLLGETVNLVRFEQIEGGFSRYTHRAVVQNTAGVTSMLALRAEATDSLLDTDLAREYAIVRALCEEGFPVPRVLGFEPTREVIGRRFITTEWSPGTAVNPWRLKERDAITLDEALCQSWISDIATLHAMDISVLRNVGIDENVDAGSYVNDQVSHWVNVIRGADHHPGALVEDACRWLQGSVPAPAVTAIVHGDLRIGNMLVEGNRVTAFLDWEMAGIGDWRADVGYALIPYNAGKLLAPIAPSANGLVHPRRFLQLYRVATGWEVSDEEIIFFMVLACIKMVAILCTGIDAYMSGRSSDSRLAWLNIPVPGLVHDIVDLIERGLQW